LLFWNGQPDRQYYPDCEIVKRWAAQDCMLHDGIPFIGKFSIFTPYLFVATGFNKWGMTSSMVAAQILREQMCGGKHPCAELFRPQRLLIRAGIRKNGVGTVPVMVPGLMKREDCWTIRHSRDERKRSKKGVIDKKRGRKSCWTCGHYFGWAYRLKYLSNSAGCGIAAISRHSLRLFAIKFLMSCSGNTPPAVR